MSGGKAQSLKQPQTTTTASFITWISSLNANFDFGRDQLSESTVHRKWDWLGDMFQKHSLNGAD